MRVCLLLLLLVFSMPMGNAAGRESLFNEGWVFHRGDLEGAEKESFDDSGWRSLDLPHDWSIESDYSPEFASATGYLPGGTGWYRKEFSLPGQASGKRVYLRFEGVYRNSDVWLNGVHLGSRPNGYIDFEYDLSPHLKPNGERNVVAVRVAREDVADSRWYPGTGIYRDVWLTVVDPVHVTRHGVFATTPQISGSHAEVNSVCEVVNQSGEARRIVVRAEVADAEGTVVSRAETSRRLEPGESWSYPLYHPVESPRVWSVEDPYLYRITHRIEVDGEVVDEVATPLGIREFRFDADDGFFLNGKPMLIKGVCNHHDAGNLGAAVPRAVLERRLRLLKEIGVNAIRCSHNPMQDDLYELCDELGFLVMDEAFDEWEIGKRKWVKGRNVGRAERFGYSEDFEEWAVRDLEAMVRRARSHPSVILYSIGNEIDYPTDPYVHPKSRQVEVFKDAPDQPSMTRLAAVAPELIAAAKRMDPTRPVTMALSNAPAANAIGLAGMLDVAGYNYQEAAYDADHAAFPGRVLIGSENGDSPDAWRAVRDKPFISGQFLWTGFDFLGEAGEWPFHGSTAGIFDIAGFAKPEALWREAVWSESPVLHLATGGGGRGRWISSNGWIEPRRGDRPVRVIAFSNLPEITLFLNGRDLGTRTPEEGLADWEVPWEVGELVAVGRDAEGNEHRARLVTPRPAAGLKLSADRQVLRGDGRDAIHVTIELIDENGNRATLDDRSVTVRTEGNVKLVALENGDLRDNSHPKATVRETRGGRALAIVQAKGGSAPARITVEAEGLSTESLTVEVTR